jgi:3-isopropylmalate/(R)-2-methylmalate dehydratase small subunit
MAYRLGVDVGGTFTDLFLVSEGNGGGRLVDGTILVVGLGIGSSREHVPLAMKGSGIRGVVGRSFARIFYRNCVNLGLAIVACPAAVDAARDGSRVAIDTTGAVEVDGVAFDAPPAPPLVLEVAAAGGLVDWTASRIPG